MMSASDAEFFTAIISLVAGYCVYTNVMKRNGSRKAAFWWALVVLLLPIVFVPVYLIFRPKQK